LQQNRRWNNLITMANNPITTSVTYHSWNKDQSMIALSPNSNEVWIYQTNKAINDGSKWSAA
jgi:hypothetical protein